MTAQLYALNEGWPFGDGPLQWFCHVEIRSKDEQDRDEIHMVCQDDGQSIFCLAADTYYAGFTWNLELLKSRIADHVLKCHPEQAAT